MKPPICEFCGRDFRNSNEGGLIRFADHQPLNDGMVGHPKGTAWFCGKHIEKAQQLQSLPIMEAIQKMSQPVGLKRLIGRLFRR